MKARLASLIVAFIVGAWTLQARADAGDDVAADVLIVRPACLVATIIGSVLFAVSYPIAAISHSVKSTAHALVIVPANATFRRPLGDFSQFEYPAE